MALDTTPKGVAPQDKAARERKAIRELESRLADAYAQNRSADEVGAVVRTAHDRFSGSSVRDFVPILVERVVRRELDSGDEAAIVPSSVAEAPTGKTVAEDPVSGDPGAPGRVRSLATDRRGLFALAGAGVVAVGATAWAVTRPGSDPAPIAPAAGAAPIAVTGVVGSEKMAFFADDRVAEVFAAHGYHVTVQPAGSREISTSVDLDGQAFVFPSSLPAAERIIREVGVRTRYTPFYSPMAIATFAPIVELLDAAGAVKFDGPVPALDFGAYIEMVQRGVRWDELAGNASYRVGKNILVSTTDARTSNSAAMYLAVASYVVNDDAVVRGATAEQHVLPTLQRLFLAQGYTEGSSAGPFEEYLTAGMGATPMTWIYEAQYVAAAVAGRLRPEMVLLYPSPTVVSRHTLVPLTAEGEEIGALLHNDADLQSLAAEHGFRTGDTARFDEVVTEHGVEVAPDVVDVVDVPAYETLEHLLDGVAGAY
ncbi:three-helix bundle dimerization domain-containing protein [Nocardia sp. NPDC024068]|uniref:three-helix bundle dimerization domain-containing protein n=1 Tax=Nocardia sp. NPDC024068 TaxID=3157197 RepID=UPI003408D55E